MVKVVCFDLGGVLIRITQKWHEAAKFAGVSIRQDLPLDAHLLDAPFFDPYQANEINDAQYLEALAIYLGEISIEDATKVHNHIIVEPYAGVDRIVASLNEQGVLTACLSNTNQPHWDDMHHSGRFPANENLRLRLASHLLGLQKPDSRIFKKFEEMANATGEEIVFFDDSMANVSAAQELGWQAYWIDPSQETAPQIVAVLSRCGIEFSDETQESVT